MAGKLTHKRALVTGASSGIGQAIALLFAAEGATVACVASSQLERAQRVADQIRATGAQAHPFTADVSDWDQANSLVTAVSGRLGRVDILVNAAGIFYPTPAGSAQRPAVERMIATNLNGTFNVINAVVPLMKAAAGGKIVNISSVAGLIGMGSYSVYCATKSAIIGLTRALAVELAPHGININAVAPGNTETPMNEDIRTDPDLQQVYEYMKARTPSRRVYSTPQDMARAALFLASEDGAAMHGSTMLLDEGLSAGM